MSRLLPTNIQIIGRELAIAWNDGTESFFQLEFLRRACPCAGCGGEPDVLGRVIRPEVTHTPASYEIKSHQIVGGYAFQPAWKDGHASGLYTFDYLKRLADGAGS
jgi:DUF971 family protein